MMRYDLMHRDVNVAELDIDDSSGWIQKVVGIDNRGHMPVGTVIKDSFLDTDRLKRWWINRSIPMSRSGIRDVLSELDIASTTVLLTKSMGLSLSDQYWIRLSGTDVNWSDVNFFDNPFTEDLGDVLIGYDTGKVDIDLSSPDSTSEGNLKKRWKIIDGRRFLIKGGSGPERQEPLNEVVAHHIADSMHIDNVRYDLLWDGSEPYSVCEDFVSSDQDFISMYHIMHTGKKDSSVYLQTVNCCEAIGIDIVPFLDRMIVLDYIIANGDRHLNNFGLIRDAASLEWISPAPVFDSGSSMGFDQPTAYITPVMNYASKPFNKDPERQLSLVTDLTWIDFDEIHRAIDESYDVFSSSERIGHDRTDAILSMVSSRADHVEKLSRM